MGIKNDKFNRVSSCLVLLFAALAPFPVAAVEWNKATDFVWNIGTGKIDVFPGQGSGNIWAAGEL